MELILERIAKRKTYTIGRLYIRQQVMDEYLPGTKNQYFCDTLEPTWRDYEHGAYKVKGHSAIPEGRYAVVISWSPKFKEWLPLLLGGPDFNKKWKGIRIHAGNMSCDTEGCILVGENREVGKVLDSRRYVNLLKRRLSQRPEGEGIHLTIE